MKKYFVKCYFLNENNTIVGNKNFAVIGETIEDCKKKVFKVANRYNNSFKNKTKPIFGYAETIKNIVVKDITEKQKRLYALKLEAFEKLPQFEIELTEEIKNQLLEAKNTVQLCRIRDSLIYNKLNCYKSKKEE